jgi:hypothetical protein
LCFHYFFKINLKFIAVINNTIISQIYIHTTCGIKINISLNFNKSELGQTLKSSIIYNSVATHKNCKIYESKFHFLAKKINHHAIINKIRLENIELNQKIQVKIINQAKKYITFSAYFCFLSHIYNNIFQKIALHIYHHIKTKIFHHHAVITYQLQSLFI